MENIKSYEEYINESITDGTMTIMSDEFGKTDKEFLQIIWHMSLSDLEDLLKTANTDLKDYKRVYPQKGTISALYRREANIAEGRIRFLEEVISDKKEDPDYIPALYK
jgi:hypothetical protein